MSDCVGGRILMEPNNHVVRVNACSQKHTKENEPMKTNHLSPAMTRNRWKFKRWTVCGIALVSFAAGSLITARLAHINQVRADSNRVFELRVYHAVPGKLPALE